MRIRNSTFPVICLLDHDLKAVQDSAMSHSLTFAHAFLTSTRPIEIWAHSSCDIRDSRVKNVFKLSQGTVNRLAGRGHTASLQKLSFVWMLLVANLSYFLALWRVPCPSHAILFVSNS